MVVKRKTRNNGNTHRNPTIPRVQPLLKCAPSFAPNPLRAPNSHLTERSLQLNGSHSSSSISSSQSHKSCSQLHALRFEPAEGGLTQL
jgi:hypothetical protein